MRKSLLATVAAAALIAGAGMASAAEGAKEQPKAAAPSGHSEMQRAPDAKAGGAMNGKAETTGAGEMKAEPKAAAEPRANADVKGKTGGKAEMKPDAKTNADMKGKADNKAEMKPDSKTKSGTDQKSSAQGKDNAATKSSADTKSSSDTKSSAQTDSKAGASANLTTEQKTKIRTTVIQSKSSPKVSRSSINFNISVGTVVPRDRVHYVAVTPTLIEIHPEWRGHMYFVVDDEIIIVDSRGRIVAIVEV